MGHNNGSVNGFNIFVFRKIIRVILIVTAIFHLVYQIYRFGHGSLQMDFAAFYTAGEAINRNLSPYVNHVTHHPPIWDGVAAFTHSRFLYPPLMAVLFQPIARMPYFLAKHVWTIINFLSILLAIFMWMKFFNYDFSKNGDSTALMIVFVSTFPPVLAVLERGQVDGLTFLLFTWTLNGIIHRSRKETEILSGILLALVSLFKLHNLYILCFVVLRKLHKTLFGSVCGILLIVIISLIVHRHLFYDYVSREFPRIARYGEGGNEEMRLPASYLSQLRGPIPDGYTIKDGRIYQIESFRFIGNASLVRILGAGLRRLGLDLPPALLSCGMFLLLWALMWIWEIRCRVRDMLEPFNEAMYWQIASIIVLLSAPLTWSMNLVWLIPTWIPLTAKYPYHGVPRSKLWVRQGVGIIGLWVAWFPDSLIMKLPVPMWLSSLKYVIAELLIASSLIMLITCFKAKILDKGGNIAAAFPEP